jgi:hypothetical protein
MDTDQGAPDRDPDVCAARWTRGTRRRQETCNNAYNRAKKAYLKLENERKAKAPEKALAGVLCVRYATGNEAFDVSDTHDGKGFCLLLAEVEAKFSVRNDFEGALAQ